MGNHLVLLLKLIISQYKLPISCFSDPIFEENIDDDTEIPWQGCEEAPEAATETNSNRELHSLAMSSVSYKVELRIS